MKKLTLITSCAFSLMLVSGCLMFYTGSEEDSLKVVAQESNPDPHAWTTGISSKEKDAWAGIAFERVCLLHVSEAMKHNLALVTTKGLVNNEYARKAQNVIFLDQLFAEISA